MDTLILPATPEDCIAFGREVHLCISPDFRGIKQIRHGKIYGFVGYDHWTENAVEMHIWLQGKHALTRKLLQEAFTFPFVTCNKGVVIGVTPGYNASALEFNRSVGFKETYRIRDGWSLGTDMVIQEMRRDECRWLRRDHDTEYALRSAASKTDTDGRSTSVTREAESAAA